MTKKDKDIQRYTSGKCGGLPAVFDNGDVMKTKYVASLLNGIEAQAKEIEKLKDFIIWMTGADYDFTQHPYYLEKMKELINDNV